MEPTRPRRLCTKISLMGLALFHSTILIFTCIPRGCVHRSAPTHHQCTTVPPYYSRIWPYKTQQCTGPEYPYTVSVNMKPECPMVRLWLPYYGAVQKGHTVYGEQPQQCAGIDHFNNMADNVEHCRAALHECLPPSWSIHVSQQLCQQPSHQMLAYYHSG